MSKLEWKLKTKYNNSVHLYILGEEKTLCGKPQEDYDTEEGTYSLREFNRFQIAACKNCLKKAIRITKKALSLQDKETIMPRQSAKDFVISHVPNARAEKQTRGKIKGMQTTYWLIRDGNSSGYMGNGETEAKAWKDAKEYLETGN